LIKRSTAIAVADLTERTSVKGRGHKGTQGSYEVTDRHPKMVGFAVVTPIGSSVLQTQTLIESSPGCPAWGPV
jgi:hypothetical protein